MAADVTDDDGDRTYWLAVAERVRAIMAVYELTPEQMQDMLGVKQNSTSQLINGKRFFRVQYARILRRKLGVSLDYLYCGDHGTLPIPLAHALLHRKTLSTPTD